jgi:hypothetical protein
LPRGGMKSIRSTALSGVSNRSEIRYHPNSGASAGNSPPARSARPCFSLPSSCRAKRASGVKGRPAQPVDRSVPADQRGGPAIADQPIIFDTTRHVFTTRAGAFLQTLIRLPILSMIFSEERRATGSCCSITARDRSWRCRLSAATSTVDSFLDRHRAAAASSDAR